MIQEIVMHTEKSDIPDGYLYDAETPDFYVYRHKYTGREIHKAKVPPLYVNVQDYIDEVLDKISAEMLEEMLSHSGTGEEVIQAYADGLKKGLDIIDKYKAKEQNE